MLIIIFYSNSFLKLIEFWSNLIKNLKKSWFSLNSIFWKLELTGVINSSLNAVVESEAGGSDLFVNLKIKQKY